MEMQLCSNTASAVVYVAVLLISGDWSTLSEEMQGLKKGGVSYGMTLAWTAICVSCHHGHEGCCRPVCSPFSKEISIVGMPLSPVIGVIFLKKL